ncbi:MAG: hypothetical protein ACE363_14780 [Alphaproteobacteria bacterium]
MGRTTLEGTRSIDVNYFNKNGCLRNGWSGSMKWTRNGEIVASINCRTLSDQVHLTYRHRQYGGEWEQVNELVNIEWAPCTLGGERPYFLCPGSVNACYCARRVTKLYGAGKYFLCRDCYGLSYASQNEEAWDRALRRANKIRMRLGGEPGTASPFPDRPKGMWRSTYERLRKEVYKAEIAANDEFEQRYAHLLAGLYK